MKIRTKFANSFLLTLAYSFCIGMMFVLAFSKAMGTSALRYQAAGVVVLSLWLFSRCLRNVNILNEEVIFEFYIGKPLRQPINLLKFSEAGVINVSDRQVWIFMFSNFESILAALGANKAKIQSALWATSNATIAKQNDYIVAGTLAIGLFVNALGVSFLKDDGAAAPIWSVVAALAVAILNAHSVWLTFKKRLYAA